jgi:hypothetical protein
MAIENIQNPNMHYGKRTLVGVLPTPNEIPRQNFDAYANRKLYNEARNVVYKRLEKAPEPTRGKFPTVLKIALPLIGVGSFLLFRKNMQKGITRFFKNLTK